MKGNGEIVSDDERVRFQCGKCKKVNSVPRAMVDERRLEWDVKCANCDALLPAPTRVKPRLLQSTTDSIPGYEILEHKGLVMAAVSTMLFGKIINKQEDRLTHAAEKAVDEMSIKAANLGANALIGIRMSANNVEGGALASNSTGVLASGTAVYAVPAPERG